MVPSEDQPDLQITQLLEPDEQLHVHAEVTDARMLVTDRRVAVAINVRVAMAVPVEGLRRIQFDVERDRHATLVLVPDHPADPPQVLVIPPHQYAAVGQAIALIGQRFANSTRRRAGSISQSEARRPGRGVAFRATAATMLRKA